MKHFLLLLSLCTALVCQAQHRLLNDHPPAGFPENFHCPSDVLKQERMMQDDTFRLQQQAFEQQYVRAMQQKSQGAGDRSLPPMYTVPVVVHIIHSGEALGSASNPTDATVINIMQQASDRFLHTSGATFPNNPYSGYNAEIQFCMAQRTPSNVATTGVERYNNPAQASPSSFSSMVTYLNGLAWNKSRYCNLFIVTNAPPDFNFAGVYTNDMTIYVSTIFWSGLVAHELGHYFSLAHTFQGACPNSNCLSSGDGVCDTQPKATSGYAGGSCASPANSCTTDPDDPSTNNPFRPVASGGLGDKPDILENYMDYTGPCWAAFTQGQVARMRNNISTSRSLLVNANNACTAPPAPLEFIAFQAWQHDEKNVRLSWETAQEHHVAHFDVEYSPDGVSFKSIGRVDARNSDQNETYAYQHLPGKPGTHYYRIRETDLDGSSMLTGIQSVKMRTVSPVSIFPTYTRAYIQIEAPEETIFRVFNTTGQLMTSGTTRVMTTALDVESWPAGFYSVQAGSSVMRFYKY